MATKTKKQTEEFEYRAEMKQLLHLIVHSLYTHPEVFLRELISNASDALNKIRFRMLTDTNVVNPDVDLKISIEVDPKKQTLSIEDTGIGMTKDELISEIGTVAHSGTLELLQKMKQDNKPLDANLIGQFGVGFYSVFMVTDEVTVETRHADPDSKGYRWVSSGENKFTIEEIDKKNRGTKISFKLKDEHKDFAEDYRVKEVIKRYSNFVDFPIFVGKEEVNRVTALWHKPKDQIKDEELTEFYKFISNDLKPPLGHLHISIEGAVNFKALVFIPETGPPVFLKEHLEKSLQLYSNKIFIQDDCKELLPEYLRFVEGVVDTEDLPLNVSREVTQSSPAMAKIRNVLTGKILGFLEDWAENEKNKYEKFYKNFGQIFKTGVNSDFTNKDRIVNLLRFESTKVDKGELTSLKDYVSRMKEDQKEIYYLSGEHREELERNPNLEYFRKNELEVLLLTDPFDVFIVPSLDEYDKKPLNSIDKADLDIKRDEKEEKEALSENLANSLIEVFKQTLGDKVEDVIASKRLVDSPATLVVGKQGMDKQMEKMMKMMNTDYAGSKKILEINLSHPLIKNLGNKILADTNDAILRNSMLQIYEGALLLEGALESPNEFVSRMTDLMVEATK
ncbi:molecular chaperone HtpG [candidate division KSB1 bacterium]|nr:molecular chaperone HtpG [candidate division KSB1 bacterium]NIR73191.1 molecular chaperone HtpG [candidate division KSB1 bacterium]NIS28340.1 molecular chaperone HtpG [candidate division KSB1 bacterium]NIT75232.1 molecular chaperone HtpG [candidate division KSB1 bacterium]NIU29072.1 molecular chaperone HtpG [candidate division KSB1 bacterium]